MKLVHPEYQVNHWNHSFVVGWDKLSPWSSLVKGRPPQPPPGGYSGYPYFGCTTKNQVFHPALDFYFFSEISSRNPLYTTWYQWRLVRTWLSSINWQNKLQKSSKLKFLKFWDCKTFLCNKISTFCFGTYFRTLLLHLWNLIDMELN